MSKNELESILLLFRIQIAGKDLKTPANIGEAYNNHMVSQDLNDVNNNKIYVKAQA